MLSDLGRQRERAAKNESVFRDANERIEDLAANAAFLEFVCECADAECSEGVSVTLEEYEHVRSDPAWFFVLAGHEIPEVENVVQTTDRYLVISKLGEGAALAMELDPRKGCGARPGFEAQPSEHKSQDVHQPRTAEGA